MSSSLNAFVQYNDNWLLLSHLNKQLKKHVSVGSVIRFKVVLIHSDSYYTVTRGWLKLIYNLIMENKTLYVYTCYIQFYSHIS